MHLQISWGSSHITEEHAVALSRRGWAATLMSVVVITGGLAEIATGPASAAVAPLKITTTSLPGAVEGNGYNATIAHSGGTGKVTFGVVGGVPGRPWIAPFGLTLEPWGQLHGVADGRSDIPQSITVMAVDSATPQQSVTATIPLSYTVADITTTSLPVGRVGVAYPSTAIKHVGCKSSLITYYSNDNLYALPVGLKLSSGGALSGTPLAVNTNFDSQVEIGFDNRESLYLSNNTLSPCGRPKFFPLTILPMEISQPKPIT